MLEVVETVPLTARSIFAMPVGPPFGGMTGYAALLRQTEMLRAGPAILFDTTPARQSGFASRVVHAIRNIGRLLALVRKERPDIVYFMTSSYKGFYEKGLMALLCRRLGARAVLHPVGTVVRFHQSAGLWRIPATFILRHVDAILAVEPETQRYLSAIAPSTPVLLVPNPVDCRPYGRSFKVRPGRANVQVLFSGAIIESKGVFDLLAAVSRFRSQLDGALFVFIGRGDAFDRCLEQARDTNIGAMVRFEGYVDEAVKRRLLMESDVYCLPSHAEGTPLSVLEAMAAGLPIVATRVGGIPFAVEEGRQGLLVPPLDVDSLGKALVALVSDQELRIRMGENAFHRVRRHFDVTRIAGQFAAAFNHIAGKA